MRKFFGKCVELFDRCVDFVDEHNVLAGLLMAAVAVGGFFLCLKGFPKVFYFVYGVLGIGVDKYGIFIPAINIFSAMCGSIIFSVYFLCASRRIYRAIRGY